MAKKNAKISNKKVSDETIAIGAGVALLAVAAVAIFRSLRKNTQVENTSYQVVASSSGGSGGSGSNTTTYNPFAINIQWLNGSTYQNYASLQDALDKNLEGEGFTNSSATIYATSMDNGNKAFTSAQGTTTYPAGSYYYETTGEMLSIASDGTMTFSSNITKVNPISVNIKDSYQ